MDKRLLIAVLLAVAVVLITPKLFPPAPGPVPAPGADSTASSVNAKTADSMKARAPASTPAVAPAAATPAPGGAPNATPAAAAAPAETASVATPTVTWRFTSAGASLIGASLADYRVLPKHDRHVALARAGVPLLAYRVLHGADTLDLRKVAFRAAPSSPRTLSYSATTTAGTVTLQYAFVADSYLVHVRGTLRGTDGAAIRLAVVMPDGLASSEADTLDDQRNLAYVWKPPTDEAESVPFATIVKKEWIRQEGPFEWVASKSKYFLLAVITTGKSSFSGPALFSGSATNAKVPATASGEMVLTPDGEGAFSFDVYAGPQQWRRLIALGHGLQDANPYGSFARGLIQPISRWVMAVLLWMHDTFRLNYGWVLVIFGIGVRLILWPLNQSAMRSSLRMQRVQPELQALQAKYKGNPEKMHAEYMKLLEQHGMTPFSQFSGCLPMLIPMPVLFALFFVFRNTIEFRGVPFLWMADISLKDPYFILPVLMGLSMFALSWVGLRNAPPNPQAKMMGYMMPGLMVVLFMGFPAGLNLYYAVQNVAALPQQWLIARERAKNPAPAVPVPRT